MIVDPSLQTGFTFLPHRGVIRLVGEDVRAFLQGIVSCDVEDARPDKSLYGAFLTPQGKYLHDFFLCVSPHMDEDATQGEVLLLECQHDQIADFMKRLNLYKLRAQVRLEDISDTMRVAVLFGSDALVHAGLNATLGASMPMPSTGTGMAFVDPRLLAAGVRVLLPHAASPPLWSDAVHPCDWNAWDRYRLALGLSDGARDLVQGKSLLMESNFDELNGISWNKGCYMGQEVTARTKYRGLIKKRLLPVVWEAMYGETPPPFGVPLMMGNGEEPPQRVGEMRSTCGASGSGRGLALVQHTALEQTRTFHVHGNGGGEGKAYQVEVEIPPWL